MPKGGATATTTKCVNCFPKKKISQGTESIMLMLMCMHVTKMQPELDQLTLRLVKKTKLSGFLCLNTTTTMNFDQLPTC